MAETKSKKIVVVRVRGDVNLSEPLEHTFDMLNLHNKNWCVVLENTPSNLGMVKKVKDYVTWGEITEENYANLFEKRGESYNGKTEDSKSLIKYKKFTTYKGKKYKKYFRLQPPEKGFGRNSIKINFNQGGALGDRKEKINDLLKRMI